MFQPEYKLSGKMVSALIAIAEAKAAIERAKLLPKQELKLRHRAMIRMTHASTKIEGNALNLRQVEAIYARQKIDAPARDIYEVENYLKALRYISQRIDRKKPITNATLLKIHQLVTDKTLPESQSGHYRKGLVCVVRRRVRDPWQEEIIYTAPAAKKIPGLINNLVEWLNRTKKEDIHPAVAAGIAHQEIAAIHPFTDGNGRTARALATLVLYQRGYDFRQLFALEDYYNKNRASYYQAISMGKNYETRRTDLTPWLEYFIKGFKEEIDSVKVQVITLSRRKIDETVSSQVYLDKEQIKIIDALEQMSRITINDATDILECPKRTAQLHLQKLKKIKIIDQIGKGPASAYVLAK